MAMFDFSSSELATIDEALEPKLAWAKQRSAEAQQWALDATRLLSCTSDRLGQYRNKGFFKRCWYALSGKTGDLQRANDRDLVEMQKFGWRYINLLQENDLMLAHSLITVRNNLLTLAVAEGETRREIQRMAERVYNRFERLEERMKNVEAATSIHGWLLTLETRDYDERFSPHFRLLAVVRDFSLLKEGDWNVNELRYLQKGIKEAGLSWKESITLARFLDELVEEIELREFGEFEKLVVLPHNGSSVPSSFVLENIAVPSYVSLFELADKYSGSSETIRVLADELNTAPKEALKRVMRSFVLKQGVDLEVQLPLKDLAVELLSCMRLASDLFFEQKQQERGDVKAPEQTKRIVLTDDWVTSSASAATTDGPAVTEDRLCAAEKMLESEEPESAPAEELAGPALSDLLDAAEQGDKDSQYKLGRLFLDGKQYKRDTKKAIAWLEKAGAAGHAEACLELAKAYQRGIGVLVNREKAREWYAKAIDSGCPRALIELGAFYMNFGNSEEKQGAKDLFSRGIEEGLIEGHGWLGQWLEQNEQPERALEAYRKGISVNDARSMNMMGRLYRYGTFVGEDDAKALRLFRQAAEQGSSDALVLIGQSLLHGWGVKEDEEKAVEYFRRAAAMNNSDALVILAVLDDSHAVAAECYRLAAELGDAEGQYGYARYLLGEFGRYADTGVPPNKREAAELLWKAAEQRHLEARLVLGLCYERGLGVSENKDYARKLYAQVEERDIAHVGLCARARREAMDASLSRIHVFPDIPLDVWGGAEEAYAKDVPYNSVVMQYDSTIMLGGEKGILLTPETVLWNGGFWGEFGKAQLSEAGAFAVTDSKVTLDGVDLVGVGSLSSSERRVLLVTLNTALAAARKRR